MKIAVDAMGGDYAPDVIIDAVNDLRDEDFEIILIGDENVLKGKTDVEIFHTPEIIKMNDVPSLAFRKKKKSSIAIGTELQKRGKVDAFVGAGNTGAYIAFAMMELGRLTHVQRPALATFFPTRHGYVLVLDVGATMNVKPLHLFQYGVMGSICTECMLGTDKPRIGLLSVGEEEIKGNPLVKETQKLFRKSKLNFIGNVEGHQILGDVCDVLVCDGFTGNALLKFGESLVALTFDSLKETMKSSLRAKLGGMLLYPGVRQFFSRVSYSQYGGAILLGTRGVTVVCHGRSTSRAIKSAIIMASKYVRERMNERIEEGLSRNEISC